MSGYQLDANDALTDMSSAAPRVVVGCIWAGDNENIRVVRAFLGQAPFLNFAIGSALAALLALSTIHPRS